VIKKKEILLFSFFHAHRHQREKECQQNKKSCHIKKKIILRHSREKKIKRNKLAAFICLIDCYLLYEIFSALFSFF